MPRTPWYSLLEQQELEEVHVISATSDAMLCDVHSSSICL